MKNKYIYKGSFKEYKTPANERLIVMEWKEKDSYCCYFYLDDELIYSDRCCIKKMLNHRLRKELKKYLYVLL